MRVSISKNAGNVQATAMTVRVDGAPIPYLGGSGTSYCVGIWHLVNPPAGQAVVVRWESPITSNPHIMVEFYKGVDPVEPATEPVFAFSDTNATHIFSQTVSQIPEGALVAASLHAMQQAVDNTLTPGPSPQQNALIYSSGTHWGATATAPAGSTPPVTLSWTSRNADQSARQRIYRHAIHLILPAGNPDESALEFERPGHSAAIPPDTDVRFSVSATDVDGSPVTDPLRVTMQPDAGGYLQSTGFSQTYPIGGDTGLPHGTDIIARLYDRPYTDPDPVLLASAAYEVSVGSGEDTPPPSINAMREPWFDIDPDVWATYTTGQATPPQVSGGSLVITPLSGVAGSHYSGVAFPAPFRLDSVEVEAKQVTGTSTSAETTLSLTQYDGPSNSLGWYKTGTTLQAFVRINGVWSTHATLTYNAATHRRWRVRRSASDVHFETSDGTTWTTHATRTLAQIQWSTAAVLLSLEAGTFASVTSPGVAEFGPINMTAASGGGITTAGGDDMATPILTGQATAALRRVPIYLSNASGPVAGYSASNLRLLRAIGAADLGTAAGSLVAVSSLGAGHYYYQATAGEVAAANKGPVRLVPTVAGVSARDGVFVVTDDPDLYGAPTDSTALQAIVGAPVQANDARLDNLDAKISEVTADVDPAQIAAAILVTPANKLATSAAGQVTAASVQGNVTGSVASVTAPVTAGTVTDKSGYALQVAPPSAAQVRQEIDANSTKLDVAVSSRAAPGAEMALQAAARGLVATEVLGSVVEGTTTLAQGLRGIMAVLLGKTSNGGRNFRDLNDTKTRITSTTDTAGNRLTVTRDLT